MDREVSHITELGVSMIAMAVIIGIIMGTVYFGRDIRTNGINYLVDVNNEVSNSFLTSMNGTAEVMPSAAAFSILKTYGVLISKTDCKVCNETIEQVTDNPCIIKHLKGKVSLGVSKVKSGDFEVEIHKEDCPWIEGTCNCN